jgi:predicted GH43/DUF377 family glycosyl hydrolase
MQDSTLKSPIAEAEGSSINSTCLVVNRRAERFAPEHTRVITKFFLPGKEIRIRHVIDRVLALTPEQTRHELDAVIAEFAHRHRRFKWSLMRNFERIAGYVPDAGDLSEERRLLLGAHFTHEFSVSAAAMFNPSIIADPDQSDATSGAVRFIMSFRATGEGHISSIEFRSGVINEHGDIAFDPLSRYLEIPEVIVDSVYEKRLFSLKLREMGADNEVSDYILNQLGDEFTLGGLENAVQSLHGMRILPRTAQREAVEAVLWLAKSNYTIRFPKEHEISERVIFPVSSAESRGIEDARFVRFVDDDGSVTYYATYTAYNGFRILPQLIETTDFITFKVLTLNGKAAHDKGMALFPRKINGKYVMLGRQDGENLYLMYSDNIHFWYDARPLQSPEMPWEFIQIGNNGSPIETPEGWLMLTHGVGAMRKYCIGCTLLDLDDPSRIIGRLNVPLLCPNTEEREGYVPNVVYSCGAMIHRDQLIIPYAMSDSVSGIATIAVADLLRQLKQDGHNASATPKNGTSTRTTSS